ncbi:WD40/YVTN/BNR-like repeat-containing protein [Lederbergia wuyishanensis]|uniref:Photosystem II stability/assembly factor-like uncharacterized protein n=1 Tax=Lederbergia wuyishanensis TaxID=1347903 RepID=A0ABU0D6K1_9BACI|nr:hypothetical protein [Lederbergia wuyishanensis]MCJ8008545.1 hypothetical protein [Lederbergia wuyishanensis]MDQ0344041.1 photosystem II stability/assembly factor-like uncharacterized protein [Lederbergia wuyishanensis]
MVSALYFVARSSVFKVQKTDSVWGLIEMRTAHEFYCLAVDPTRRERLYAGTFNDGLWISDDGGLTWEPAGKGIFHDRVLSVAVSPTEVINGYSVVWAGTEPSELFRSEDGGKTWIHFPKLLDLPSKPTWRFPPRPHTHHVRWIQPDLHDEQKIYVGIELGGVMKSEDKGIYWEDRKPGSQYDCHTLTMNRLAKGRIYEAAGGGFAESLDGGETWATFNDGLGSDTYLVDIAVDPANPDTMVASAAHGAYSAYDPQRASTVIVRRKNGKAWEVVTDGLPEREGSSIFSLISHESEPGIFYAVNNLGIFQSIDAGKSWKPLLKDWPKSLIKERVRWFVAV